MSAAKAGKSPGGTPADLMAREGDGRFAAGFERVCTCGHKLGEHTAARPHECLAVDCECLRFARKPGPRAARKRKVAT